MNDWVVFDYDGTLATHRSGWTLLHSVFGTGHVQKERVEAYRAGDLLFEEWADLDVQNWVERGATRDDIELAADAVKISNGAPQTLSELENRGYRFGILSGGVRQLTSKIQKFNPEFICANRLKYDGEGNLDGVDKEVGPSEKAEVLKDLGKKYGFNPNDVTFVGDSHSDLEAFEIVNKAILFDPDPALKKSEYDVADIVIAEHDLTQILDPL